MRLAVIPSALLLGLTVSACDGLETGTEPDPSDAAYSLPFVSERS